MVNEDFEPKMDCPVCGSPGIFDRYVDRVRTARMSCSNPECEHLWITGPYVKNGHQDYETYAGEDGEGYQGDQ